jgi:hypothetical protein
MVVARALKAGLVTGITTAVLAVICTLFMTQVRTVWTWMFTPLVVTGVYAVRRGGGITSARAALLVGALAGLLAAALTDLGLVPSVILQTVIPNWPYPGSQHTPGSAYGLIGILSDSPFYIPREQLFVDLPLALPFPWPFARALPNGVTVSRLPVAWLWFFPVGAGLAALQAWLYYALTRRPQVAGRIVNRLARYPASFQNKLLLGFTLLGVLIFAIGWLGFAAV